MSAAPLITAKDLKVHFPTRRRGRTVKAVDGVSFTVEPSRTLGIIGESGSGKSTLGRVLVSLTKPTGGTLLHGNEDPFKMSTSALRAHRRDYQIIFQDPHAALNPRMTIHASVREPLDIIGKLPIADRDTRVRELLERVGIGPTLHSRYPHELSGGQKQRVNIARALTTQPKVLVCDEVVAALDVSIQAGILNLFAELQRDFGLTYIFITHDLAVASHVSDDIAVMYLGQLMEMGPADAIRSDPQHPYSQSLMLSEPEPMPSNLRHKNRVVLQGDIPSPITPPSGCRFHTRCPKAQSRCSLDVPLWHETKPSRWVACHYPGGSLQEEPEESRPISATFA
jgi:peptide/nickel transport system ATP-binding protein/oligopeptide transport system ATP-binding protein